jgi:hypothetical protein
MKNIYLILVSILTEFALVICFFPTSTHDPDLLNSKTISPVYFDPNCTYIAGNIYCLLPLIEL